MNTIIKISEGTPDGEGRFSTNRYAKYKRKKRIHNQLPSWKIKALFFFTKAQNKDVGSENKTFEGVSAKENCFRVSSTSTST